MKKLRRRAISLILSVVMILSMMPAISWATVTESDETEWIQGIIAQLEYIDDHQQELTQFTDVSPYYWAYYDIMEAVNEHSSTKQNGVESWSDVKKK